MRWNLVMFLVLCVSGCASSRFYELSASELGVALVAGYITLPPIGSYANHMLQKHCEALDEAGDIGAALLLRRAKTLLMVLSILTARI